VIFALLLVLQSIGPPCGSVVECRTLAQEAAGRGDYELFHDLAWRAFQKGKPNDPELMYLVARAQSLSGRPADALVMLNRLADLHVPTDAGSNEDFARVRLLKDWPALEAKLAGTAGGAPPAPAPGRADAPPEPAVTAAPGSPRSTAAAPAPKSLTKAPSAPISPAVRRDALTFEAPAALDPIGLAHDTVSRRFVLGDRKARRLIIIDEVSRNVVNYVSAASAGFYEELTGLAIDARRGDLWVVSAGDEAGVPASAMHKLQLVSGRALLEARVAASSAPVHFVGIAVTDDGTVYALDAADSRLFRLRPGSRTLEDIMRLDTRGTAALAAADDRTLYVAAEKGLFRVDVISHNATPVQSRDPLTGVVSLAWHNGSLIAVQRTQGSSRIIRVPLDRAGSRAERSLVLASAPENTVGVLTRDDFFYLADPGVIRRIKLR
jgi:hypothetical protein